MSTPAIVLGNGITALSVAQPLGRNAVPVYLLGSDRHDIAYHSRYVTAIDQGDVRDPEVLLDQIQQIANSLDSKPVLLCCTDFFLQMVLTDRERIGELCHLNLPSSEAIATVLNKGLFGEFCTTHNLPAPRSWTLESPENFEECRGKARFPVAIKPLFSHNAKAENFNHDGRYSRMILAKNANELKRYYTELTGYGANLVVQEYIDGPDSEHYSYVSCRDAHAKEVVGIGLRKLRVFPIHAGVGTFVEVTEDNELVTESNRLLDKLNYKGISSVCFKRDMNSGRLILHEVNGRFPQPHSGSRLCGIDLPHVTYQVALGEKPALQRVAAEQRKWIILGLDFDAFRRYRRQGEMSTLDWLKSLRQVRVVTEFSWDDLKPFLFFLKNRLQRILHIGVT